MRLVLLKITKVNVILKTKVITAIELSVAIYWTRFALTY